MHQHHEVAFISLSLFVQWGRSLKSDDEKTTSINSVKYLPNESSVVVFPQKSGSL